MGTLNSSTNSRNDNIWFVRVPSKEHHSLDCANTFLKEEHWYKRKLVVFWIPRPFAPDNTGASRVSVAVVISQSFYTYFGQLNSNLKKSSDSILPWKWDSAYPGSYSMGYNFLERNLTAHGYIHHVLEPVTIPFSN